MSRVQQLLIPELDKLQNKLRRAMNIVETGTIRNTGGIYQKGDGWSTLHIAQWIKQSLHKHQFYSVDLDTSVAQPFIISKGLGKYVKFRQTDSRNYLNNFPYKIDFCYLDSANDPDLILAEFKIAATKTDHIIIVDDFVPGSKEKQKGNKLFPFLQQNNYNFEVKGITCIISL